MNKKVILITGASSGMGKESAKNILNNTDHSVSEIAYSLGFEYPQYFSKLFKQKTGQTPLEYRKLN
jgi:AraC-like DNA-binding protein